jgi:hypothetical protein
MQEPMIDDREVLARLGAPNAPLLGAGGEAQVYALSHDRVARIMRAGAHRADAASRAQLLAEIAAGRGDLPFMTPTAEAIEEIGGRIVSVEPRLPGEPLSLLLGCSSGSVRSELIESYLDTALRLREIRLPPRGFGSLIGHAGPRGDSWGSFATARLRRSAEACPPDLRAVVLLEAAAALAEPAEAALVHLDYFPANVLAADGRVTAVLDFGPSAAIGDPRMDAWGAVAYLDPEITPTASLSDREQATAWLARAGLDAGYIEARRWLAAYWSFAADDARLIDWCRRILLAPRR